MLCFKHENGSLRRLVGKSLAFDLFSISFYLARDTIEIIRNVIDSFNICFISVLIGSEMP